MSQPADNWIAGKAENPPAWVQGFPRKGSSSRILPMRPQPTIPVLNFFTENEEKVYFPSLYDHGHYSTGSYKNIYPERMIGDKAKSFLNKQE